MRSLKKNLDKDKPSIVRSVFLGGLLTLVLMQEIARICGKGLLIHMDLCSRQAFRHALRPLT